MSKHIVKNMNKNLSSKYIQKILDHAKTSTTDTFKTASKIGIKKKQMHLVIWLVIKLLIELQIFHKM